MQQYNKYQWPYNYHKNANYKSIHRSRINIVFEGRDQCKVELLQSEVGVCNGWKRKKTERSKRNQGKSEGFSLDVGQINNDEVHPVTDVKRFLGERVAVDPPTRNSTFLGVRQLQTNTMSKSTTFFSRLLRFQSPQKNLNLYNKHNDSYNGNNSKTNSMMMHASACNFQVILVHLQPSYGLESWPIHPETLTARIQRSGANNAA